MHHKHLFALLLLALTPALFAQNTLKFNNKDYPATANWDFLCERYALSGKADIQIAATEKGGLLQIAMRTNEPAFYIGGTVYLYLENQDIIVCTDKNLRKSNADATTAWFLLTSAEMKKLRTSRLGSVRFNIRGKADAFSGQTGNFTAVNKKSYFSFALHKPEQFETETEIAALVQP